MKKYQYVKATLTLGPTMEAAQKKKARASIQGPLTGTLMITNWRDFKCTRLDVKGSLEPEPTPVPVPKKVKARTSRKKAGQ